MPIASVVDTECVSTRGNGFGNDGGLMVFGEVGGCNLCLSVSFSSPDPLVEMGVGIELDVGSVSSTTGCTAGLTVTELEAVDELDADWDRKLAASPFMCQRPSAVGGLR